MRPYLICVILTCVLFGACQAGAGKDTAEGLNPTAPASAKPVMSDPQNFNQADQKACTDFGGTYTQAGLLGSYNCFVDYADGGKVCSDISDCQGRCIATDTSRFDPDAPGGQVGTCQVNDNPFGCYSEIIGGFVQPGLCVD